MGRCTHSSVCLVRYLKIHKKLKNKYNKKEEDEDVREKTGFNLRRERSDVEKHS